MNEKSLEGVDERHSVFASSKRFGSYTCDCVTNAIVFIFKQQKKDSMLSIDIERERTALKSEFERNCWQIECVLMEQCQSM